MLATAFLDITVQMYNLQRLQNVADRHTMRVHAVSVRQCLTKHQQIRRNQRQYIHDINRIHRGLQNNHGMDKS